VRVQTAEREIAVDILLLVLRDGEHSHIALKNTLDKHQHLEKRERAFITRVVNGTLERMIEIDYIINRFSKIEVRKMKPAIRMILRSGVYQLKYMEHVPARAVCNEAVKLAAKKGFVNLKGFVNGVLRNISRNMEQISYPPREDSVSYISVKYSLPEWLVKQWLSEYDVDTVICMGEDFLKEKPLSIRCNTCKLQPEELQKLLEREGVTVKREPLLSCAFYIEGYDSLARLGSFQEGCFYVQDISSMQVAHWAKPEMGDFIIDVCAAPGGKALHLAECLKGTGCVEARDLTDYKMALIEENIERTGLSNIKVRRWDATRLDRDSYGKADIVIADLPCSGFGVLGKKPDLKYKMTPETLEELVKLQRQILSVVNHYVKPGGKLIYSTCTIHQAENEENAAWFEKEYPQFRLEKEKQMLPGRDPGDGFYIARFRKENL